MSNLTDKSPESFVAEIQGKRQYLKGGKYPTLANPPRVPWLSFWEQSLSRAGFPIGTTVNIEVSSPHSNYPGSAFRLRIGWGILS